MGKLLAHFAQELVNVGLMRVNVSLDTINSARYAELTRGGDINNVFAGLDAAQKVGLCPIKINCVIENTAAEPDALAVAQFAQEHNFFNTLHITHGFGKWSFWCGFGGQRR
jgi:cyclic pyranopterin phosphate synthase